MICRARDVEDVLCPFELLAELPFDSLTAIGRELDAPLAANPEVTAETASRRAALLKTPFIFVFNDTGSVEALQVEITRKICAFRRRASPSDPNGCHIPEHESPR
jgi:hypothetical protein